MIELSRLSWTRRARWVGLVGVVACSSTGEQDEYDGGDSTSAGGSENSGGGVPFEGTGGELSTGGQVGTDGGSTGDGTGGFQPLGTGGNASTGGDVSTGGEAATGGNSATGGDVGTGGDSSGVGGSEMTDECPFSGNVTYELNSPDGWPQEARELIVEAMDDAVYYYNCYADLEKHITVNYNDGVPTAEANVDGWLSFGSNTGYMQTATAMHEVAHTLGVGYYPWSELIEDGRWIGSAVDALMNALPAEQRDPDMYSQRTYITCDTQHFWPYGLNQAAEYQSEWSLINHVRIVAAMNEDKEAFLSQ